MRIGRDALDYELSSRHTDRERIALLVVEKGQAFCHCVDCQVEERVLRGVDRVLVERDRKLEQKIRELARKRRNCCLRRCRRRSSRWCYRSWIHHGRGIRIEANFFYMSGDNYSTRWQVLALLGISELLGMSLWFAASAVSPQLRAIWGLTPVQA